MERNEIPKRRGVSPTRRGVRRLLILMTFALGVADRWSDFLIWIGAAAIFGWGISALVNRRRRPR